MVRGLKIGKHSVTESGENTEINNITEWKADKGVTKGTDDGNYSAEATVVPDLGVVEGASGVAVLVNEIVEKYVGRKVDELALLMERLLSHKLVEGWEEKTSSELAYWATRRAVRIRKGDPEQIKLVLDATIRGSAAISMSARNVARQVAFSLAGSVADVVALMNAATAGASKAVRTRGNYMEARLLTEGEIHAGALSLTQVYVGNKLEPDKVITTFYVLGAAVAYYLVEVNSDRLLRVIHLAQTYADKMLYALMR